MDPNANLEQQLASARKIQQLEDSIGDVSALSGNAELRRYDEQRGIVEEDIANEATALAELVLALDGWLSNGGFKPGRWS
jgi:hypothetical protein